MSDFAELERRLGVTFRDPSLLKLALTHPSCLNEYPEAGLASNERLEFLGDAVLGLVVADKLYRAYPGSGEGAMTRRRAALVRNTTLKGLAESIGLGDFLILGKGEEQGGGRHKPGNLARAMEAVFAAVFLDRGFQAGRRLILRLLAGELAAADGAAPRDAKTRLQEYLQERGQSPPQYRVIAASGPEHARTFNVTASIAGRVAGRGSGSSKKLAEGRAAAAALREIGGD